MSKKHVGVVVVVVLILILVQGTLWMNGRVTSLRKEANTASDAASTASTNLNLERAQLIDLTTNSSDLVNFLHEWEPFLATINTPEAAELNISLSIKEDSLITLSQRYEVVPQRGNATIPRLVRAYITFEDEFAKVFNWLGKLEARLPAARVNNLRFAKGTGGNDVRMEIVIEQPILARAATP